MWPLRYQSVSMQDQKTRKRCCFLAMTLILKICLFVYFFFILGPYSEENLSIPLFFHIAQSFVIRNLKMPIFKKKDNFLLSIVLENKNP